MKARNNRSLQVDPSLSLDQRKLAEGAAAFKSWHWGVEPKKVVDWNDPDMPPALIECGRLIQLHVRTPRATNNPRHPRRERDTMIEFSKAISNNAHVAYDPNHAHERLYLLVPEKARQVISERFWDNNAANAANLNQLAMVAGGKHGKLRDYPNLKAKPIGILTGIVYYTRKAGDENPGDPRSYYIHQMAEISQDYPILAVTQEGRIWVCGGSYTVPVAGITD